MNAGWNQLSALIWLSLSDPRRALRAVLDIAPPMGSRLAGLVLMAVASALLLHLGLTLAPPPPDNPVAALLVGSPFGTALMQGAALWVTAILIHALGRAAGGQGSYPDALLTVVWMQVIFLAVQIIQLIALLALPVLASALSLASLVLFFWLLTQFVTELHRFASAGKVFLAILATLLVVSFLLTYLLASLLGPEALGHV